LIVLLGLVAAVTAVLNLDTAAVFLTPVLVHAARRRGVDERPFLYGSVFMANAASMLLPGSNLTNMLVLMRDPLAGTGFGAQMLPAWLAACALTAAFMAFTFRLQAGKPADVEAPALQFGLGAAGTAAAAILVLLLRNPALPVLALGVTASLLRRRLPHLETRMLAILFPLTIGLGTLARVWNGPSHLLDSSGSWTAAGIGAAASVLVNNLPAAVLLSASPPAHPGALLLGLDLGPNLAVTGSLSAFLWLQAARTVGAEASIAVYSRLGVLLVPLTLAAALTALRVC
jgi:arsenical pump membrane protein